MSLSTPRPIDRIQLYLMGKGGKGKIKPRVGGNLGFGGFATRTEGPHGGASYVRCPTAMRNRVGHHGAFGGRLVGCDDYAMRVLLTAPDLKCAPELTPV